MDDQDHDDLVASLRRVARQMSDHRSIRDVQATLGQIVRSAVETIPGVDAGSVSITAHGRIETRCPTSETIRTLDDRQSELNEGPCMSALADPPPNGLVIACDFAGDVGDRWPRFAQEALASGYRSLMSTQLSAAGRTRAALNLYAHEAESFDGDARVLAGLFGIQASLLLYGAETAQHLQRAVESRDLIGQAKGILMERFALDGDRAFEMLVKSSQDTNLKLVEVARWLTTEATAVPGDGAEAR